MQQNHLMTNESISLLPSNNHLLAVEKSTFELEKGDVLYTDCKDAFMDLQKYKNDNNAQV